VLTPSGRAGLRRGGGGGGGGRPGGRAGQAALGHGLGAVDLSALIERMSLQRAGRAAPSAVTHRAECQDESRTRGRRITG
ncbi:hypothetical protein ABG768_027969, partial [Culter alburnus]